MPKLGSKVQRRGSTPRCELNKPKSQQSMYAGKKQTKRKSCGNCVAVSGSMASAAASTSNVLMEENFNGANKQLDVSFSTSFATRCVAHDGSSSTDGGRGIWRSNSASGGALVCQNGDGNYGRNAFAFHSINLQQSHSFATSNYSRPTFGQVQLNNVSRTTNRCFSVPSVSAITATHVKRQILPPFRVAPPPNVGVLKFRGGHMPLPKIAWADENDVWNLMCWKDTIYSRNPHLLQQHSTLQPKMRTILIDWLAEVCEVYKLHRETFYLACDFVDRFLSKEKNVAKGNLQLLGVTALFIAAKVEEIYPPKCSDFAYVTDGACTADDIARTEMYMLKSLNWALAPITPVHWLTTYLQIIDQHNSSFPNGNRHRSGRDFVLARYHRYHFIHLAQLIDLCMLDAGSLQFPYGVLAACAFAHILEPEYLALQASGFKFEDIATCYQWMTPFAKAAQERQEVEMKHFADISDDDMHNIQTHVADLDLLDRALEIQQEMFKTSRMSPVFLENAANILPTPPPSDERPSLCVSNFK